MGFDELRSILSGDHSLSASERLVLSVLEMHRNADTGACFPSQPKIAAMTGLTDRGVRNVLVRLQELGVISRATGARGFTFYTIDYNALPRNHVPPRNQIPPRNDVPPKQEPRSGHPGTTFRRTDKEQPKNSSARPHDEMFDALWQEYPRKIGKQAARRAWQRLLATKEDPNLIAAGVQRYCAYVAASNTEERYIKHLSSLLGRDAGWREEWKITSQRTSTASSPPSALFVTPRELSKWDRE